jgi:hypothetical protein
LTVLSPTKSQKLHRRSATIDSTTNISPRVASAVQPCPFFDLPYDVRRLAYLHFDDLPPATGGGCVINFIMSCKQAKSDVEHLAVKRAKQRLQDFAVSLLEETGVQPDISASLDGIDSNPCFAQLRQVDIAVPFDKIFETPDLVDLPSYFEQRFSYRFVTGALRAIHTLLSGHYDTVHIRLAGYPRSARTASLPLTPSPSHSACTTPSNMSAKPSMKPTADV